jgi:hypothetical protein
LVGDFLAVAACGVYDGFADADLGEGARPAVVGGAPAEDLAGADGDEVWLASHCPLFGEVAGLGGGREVDDRAGVAVEDGRDELAAGVFVEGGAVAGDVSDPLGPVGVALDVDALAEDDAGGLRGEAGQKGGQGGVEDAAVVGAVVFSRFLRDEIPRAGAEFGRSTDAEFDGVPRGLHRLDELGALGGVGVVDTGREGEGVGGAGERG